MRITTIVFTAIALITAGALIYLLEHTSIGAVAPPKLIACLSRIEFSRDKTSFLQVAIWDDGTVLTKKDLNDGDNDEYIMGTIDVHRLNMLFQGIEDSGFLNNQVPSIVTPDSGMTAIGIRLQDRWATAQWDCRAIDPRISTKMIQNSVKSWSAAYAIIVLSAESATGKTSINMNEDYIYPISKWIDSIKKGSTINHPALASDDIPKNRPE